jgi:hypothetical protein
MALSSAAFGGCSQEDPQAIAERGADEVYRHGGTRWARLEIEGLSEVEYHVAPAFVAAEEAQAPGFEREFGTTFAQRLVPVGDGDPMVLLRDDILANGGLLIQRGCSEDDPTKRFWSFVVESDGDVVSLRLTEVDGGVLYLASLPSGATEGSFRDALDDARDGSPVRALPPAPACPPAPAAD